MCISPITHPILLEIYDYIFFLKKSYSYILSEEEWKNDRKFHQLGNWVREKYR